MRLSKCGFLLVLIFSISILLERPFSWKESGQQITDYLLREIFYDTANLMEQDFYTNDYLLQDEYYKSIGTDGQFIFLGLNQGVSNVRIALEEPVVHANGEERNDDIAVYYTLPTDNTAWFTEEQSVKAELFTGTKEILLQVREKNIQDLRIDIGTAVGDEFRLDSIRINDFSGYQFWAGFASKACVTRIFLLFLICAFIALHFIVPIRTLYYSLYRYRFQIALCILVVGTALRLSGSSVGMWKQYLPQSEAQAPLFGRPRMIRSDEWGVQTPTALSQQYGNYGYFNDIVRATKTDMEIVCGQPIRSWLNIFRPYYWGYIFLPVENGLAFYWISRFLGLFLTTFEFGMILCKKNYRIAVFLAVAVLLAPAVQWWYSTPGFMEIFLFGQLVILAVYYYMHTENYLHRALWALTFTIACGGYALVLYPPEQIPGAYMYFVLFLLVIFFGWKQFRFDWTKDVPIILAALTVLFVGMGQLLLNSADAIQTVLQTAYPGKRFIQGGDIGSLLQFFRYPGNIFFPFRDYGMPANVCENASMIDFFPMGFVLSAVVLERQKEMDKCLIAMLMVDFFLIAWNIAPFPTWFAKITLFRMVTPARNLLIIEYLNLLILARALTLYQRGIRKELSFSIGICGAILVCMFSRSILGEYLTEKDMMVCCIFFCILFVAILCYQEPFAKKIFTAGTALLFLIAGGFVNPVQQGLEVIYGNPLIQKIQTITEKNNGRWLAVNMNQFAPNLLLMAGAKVINSVNPYPQLELWERLDPDGVYSDIYNRYAHIGVSMTEDTTWFELIWADAFIIHLNENDLSLLEPDFILSGEKLNLDGSSKLELLDHVENFYIYKVQLYDDFV